MAGVDANANWDEVNEMVGVFRGSGGFFFFKFVLDFCSSDWRTLLSRQCADRARNALKFDNQDNHYE